MVHYQKYFNLSFKIDCQKEAWTFGKVKTADELIAQREKPLKRKCPFKFKCFLNVRFQRTWANVGPNIDLKFSILKALEQTYNLYDAGEKTANVLIPQTLK